MMNIIRVHTARALDEPVCVALDEALRVVEARATMDA